MEGRRSGLTTQRYFLEGCTSMHVVDSSGGALHESTDVRSKCR